MLSSWQELVVGSLEWLASSSCEHMLKVVLNDEVGGMVHFGLHDEEVLLKSRKLLKLYIISANHL